MRLKLWAAFAASTIALSSLTVPVGAEGRFDDDKGGFKLPDAPDGKATLKVWSQGRWVHEQEIDVGKSDDLRIKVVEPSARESAE